jgi:hypothetical protein
LITWIVFNVTSILIPFELNPAFYKWAFVMPAHEVYQVLIDIWSRGCNPELYYALPILFALEMSGLVLSGLGVYRRCHYAAVADQAQEQAFQERVDSAMAFERKRDQERAETREEKKVSEADADRDMEVDADVDTVQRVQTAERAALAEVIRKEDSQLRRERTRAAKGCGFGPSFDVAFQDSRDDN